jgi:glycosidase
MWRSTTLLLACLVLPSWLWACQHTAGGRPAAEPTAESAERPTVERGWWEGAVFYEVFVRSFADSDGDGTGDLRGLTARLDYLNDGDPRTDGDLGVSGLWLMPIYASPSYHGYDVVDYRAIHPDYGTLADFDAFVAAAHARGIRVILDFVLNHSSSEHPWFLSAKRGPDAAHRDFYTWRDEPDARWTRPWDGAGVWHESGDEFFYALFWSGMPDVNLANERARDEMVSAMRFWLDRGVDGFRVDAARYLIEEDDGQTAVLADSAGSHRFVRELRAELERTHKDVLLVAEAWSTTEDIATYWGDGDEYQLAFSFGVAGALLESVRDKNRAHLKQELALAAEAFADRAFEAPFLTNHDMRRVMQALGDDVDAARLAAATLLALPGTPFLYYGEELGMRGGDGSGDEHKRTPMRWREDGGFTTGTPWFESSVPAGVSVAAQTDDPGSLLSWYRRLIRARASSDALARGDTSLPASEGGGRGAFALVRELPGEHASERVLFLANFADEPTTAWTLDITGTPQVLLAQGVDDAFAQGDERLVVPAVAPRGFALVALRSPAYSGRN